jgi:hypothetical protein
MPDYVGCDWCDGDALWVLHDLWSVCTRHYILHVCAHECEGETK